MRLQRGLAMLVFDFAMRNQVAWDSNLRVRDFNHARVWTTVAAAVDAEGFTGTAYPTRRVLMAPISVELTSSFRW